MTVGRKSKFFAIKVRSLDLRVSNLTSYMHWSNNKDIALISLDSHSLHYCSTKVLLARRTCMSCFKLQSSHFGEDRYRLSFIVSLCVSSFLLSGATDSLRDAEWTNVALLLFSQEVLLEQIQHCFLFGCQMYNKLSGRQFFYVGPHILLLPPRNGVFYPSSPSG